MGRGNSLILDIFHAFKNHCIQFLSWYGLERFEITTDLIFISNFASPSSLRGFVLQWRLVMAEWERWSGQSSPGVCKAENELKPTNLHLLHCRNIRSFDLVGGFGETFFILPLLANHSAGKHGVQQTWKYPPPPWDVELLQLQFPDLGMLSGNKQQFPHCLLTRRWCRCLKSRCLLHRSGALNISSWFLFSATYFLENLEASHLPLQIPCQVPFSFFFFKFFSLLHFCLTRLLYGDKCSFLLTPHNRCVKHTHMF